MEVRVYVVRARISLAEYYIQYLPVADAHARARAHAQTRVSAMPCTMVYTNQARALPVLVVHGYEGEAEAHLKGQARDQRFPRESRGALSFYRAPNIAKWGCHHTKMMLLFCRVSENTRP